MSIQLNPNSFTKISTGSCTISSDSRTELVRFYEDNKFIVESYLNTPITILSNKNIKAKSNRKSINIEVTKL